MIPGVGCLYGGYFGLQVSWRMSVLMWGNVKTLALLELDLTCFLTLTRALVSVIRAEFIQAATILPG